MCIRDSAKAALADSDGKSTALSKVEDVLERLGLERHGRALRAAFVDRTDFPEELARDLAASADAGDRPSRTDRTAVWETAENLGVYGALRAECRRLRWHHRALQGWRLVHLPLSFGLVFLVIVHVLSTWRY